MNRIRRIRKFALRSTLPLIATLFAAATLPAQPASTQAPSRFVGAITAIGATTITVKTDAGQSYQVDVPAAAVIKRIEPGERDLSKAVPMQFSDLAVGDRTLVKLDPDAPAGTQQALQIIAVKQADVAKKQQEEREDWQRRGVGGLVKSVDTSSGVIVLTSGAGTAAKTITVTTTKDTVLKRYAPASVRFDAAVLAPLDAIHPGDQLRARGTKSPDGLSLAAEEVVSGTFRNLSGIISSVEAGASTLTLKDLATKKQVTIHITADAQMRRLPERMATMLAARLKGKSAGVEAAAGTQGAAGAPHPGNGQGGGSQWAGQSGGAPGSTDPQQILNRAPAIQIGDLKKGDAIMVVSTAGDGDVTAITLVAGVEPLLEAPEASQSLLNNWSMGSSTPDTGAQ